MQTFTEECPIWRTPASEDERKLSEDRYFYTSPRAGGAFEILGTVKRDLADANQTSKMLLSHWIWTQNSQGIYYPLVTREIWQRVKSSELPSVDSRLDILLASLAKRMARPKSDYFIGNPEIDEAELGAAGASSDLAFRSYKLMAETYSQDFEDLIGLVALLNELGYLKEHVNTVQLTAAGWKRVSQATTDVTVGNKAFVAMWFSKAMDDAYDLGFAAAIRDAGYESVRIDRKEHNNKIDDEIISELRRAKFVVADFTSELVERQGRDGTTFKDTHARGGVYFEAGFAKGLGKEVIWTVREDVMNAGVLHFDTRQFSHIVWKNEADLRKQLSQRISATLGDGPNKKVG